VVPSVYYWRRSPGRSVDDPVVLIADRRTIGAMRRDVGAELEVEITAPTELEFQIAVAPHPNTDVFESLSFVLDGKTVQPLEISGVHGNRRTPERVIGPCLRIRRLGVRIPSGAPR
jgi:hypothetical protein